MKRSMIVVAALVAGLFGGTAAAEDKEVSQSRILDQIAHGRDAKPAITQYKGAFIRNGSSEGSPSIDRGAEVRQLRDAEQSLLAALQALQGKNGAAQVPAAAGAYQAWQAAALLFDAHQDRIAARLAASDAGKSYVGKHQQFGANQSAQRQQIAALLDASLGMAVTPARMVDAGTLKTALSLLAPARRNTVHEPVLHALGLPVGGVGLAARAPVLAPVLVPSYAKQLETTPLPADSADAGEAPLSDEIVKQAAALGNDYVRIYEFVRNTERTEWYAGSVRGAIGTLRSGAGNDIDQASLLVALLRASSVPSRYVRGVVELSLDKVANDLGLKDPALVPAALTRAGVAFTPVVRGGAIAAVNVEHVWVTALVPYTNYRGAVVDASGKTWIPLDPSFKDSSWTAPGLALGDLGTAASLQNDYLAQSRSETFAAYVQRRATDVLQQRQGGAVDPAAVTGRQDVVAVNLALLPNSLPYPVVAVTYESASLAASDIVQAHLTVSRGGTGVLDLTAPLHELGNDRLTLAYQPASLEDHRLALLFGGLDAVPLYLIQLRPQLNVGGKARMLGTDAVVPGSDLALDIVLTGPFGSQTVHQTVMAGAYQAIHLGGAGATRPAVTAPSDEENLGASLLDGIAVAYSQGWADGEKPLAALAGVALVRPVPAVSIVTDHMETEYLRDAPYTLVWKGVTLDAIAHPVDAVGANAAAFLALSGLHGSSLESITFANQFSVGAMSADRGLALAREQGIAVLSLDAGNVGTLTASDHAQAVKDTIQNLVRLGYKVDVPAQRLTQEAWSGSVWRAVDPASGASGYFLSGGIAGGATSTGPQVWTLDFLAAALSTPDTDPYNPNSMSGTSMVKVGIGDGQTGIVGQDLVTPLTVVVYDKDLLPVKGASVTFTYTLGDGLLAGVQGTYTTVTNKLGMATVTATLGKKTDANARYLQVDGGPNAARVSMNVIDVTATSAIGQLAITEPFTAIARPDKAAGLKRTSPALASGSPGLWSDTLVMRVADQFDNPVPNVGVSFQIASQQVCNSDKAAQYFKPGAVFNSVLDANGNFLGCSSSNPTLSTCGAPSVSSGTGTDGATSAGIILGNDVMGVNLVHVSGGGYTSDFSYTANGYCSADSTQVDQTVTANIGGAIIDASGVNISAARAGTTYGRAITTSTFFTEYPYEVRYRGSQAYIYWHPFATQVPASATIVYDVSAGGSTFGSSYLGKGQATTQLLTGPGHGVNVIKETVYATVPVPSIIGNVLQVVDSSAKINAAAPNVYGVLPTIEKIIGGTAAGDFADRIVLDTEGRSAKQVEAQYQMLPDDYQAGSAEVDIYENGTVIGTLSGSSPKDKGSAFITRGQKFDIAKNYDAKLVLNRGTKAQVDSDLVRLPTRQRLISFASGIVASTEVDFLNKRLCDIPGQIAFGFYQDVRATLVLQPLGIDGLPISGTRTIFSGKTFAAGNFTQEIDASDFGKGTFQMILTAVSATDPGQTDEAHDRVSTRFIVADQLPIAHVIVDGVKVRDGSMMAQTQGMELPGRGPSMHFQPTYASSANGTLTAMGMNWTHNFDSKVTINACGDVFVSGGDSGGVRFFPSDDGASLVPAAGYHSKMVADHEHNAFDFYTKDGTRHHYKWGNGVVQWILDSITDTNGNIVTLTYDMAALPEPLLQKVSSSDGRTYTFAYETRQVVQALGGAAHALLASVTGPGVAMKFTHDDSGNLLAADRNGRQESFSYQAGDATSGGGVLMVRAVDPNGRVTGYTYNNATLVTTAKNGDPISLDHRYVTGLATPTGNVAFTVDIPNFATSTVKNQNGATTTYHLNAYGSPLSIVDPAGTTSMTWSPTDIVMLSKTDARGVVTQYEYDAAGNKIRETTDGKSQAWTYNLGPVMKDRLTSATDYNGNTRKYLLDAAGNVTTETLPEGVMLTHVYAANGDRISTKDGNGGLTKFSYDTAGNLYTTTDPVGATTTTVRNARGQVTQIIDPLGNTTRLTLDTQDRVVERLNALGGKHTYTYDAVGNKTGEEDEAGARSTWTYGQHNLPETVTRAGGKKTLAYDGVGNKVSETDFRGNETTFAYDGANRLVTRTEPLGKVTGYGYDGIGNVLTETDALGRITTHEYDALSRRTKTVDAAQGIWLMGYDGNGNKTSGRDPLGRVTTYAYDGLNRPTVQTAPLGAVTSFTYDRNSNKTGETDPDGNVTSYVFDAANRVTDVVHADATHTFNTYDLNDNLTKTIDPNTNVTVFSYDALNRKKDMKDGAGYTTLYEYDGVGNLSAEVQPNGNRVTHGYNDLRLRTSSSDALGSLGAWDYDADGNKTSDTDGNGNTTTTSYNALGQLTGSTLPEERTLSYGYDLMGNRTSATDAMGNTATFKFDALNRQTDSLDALGNLHLTGYDAVGNKVTETDPLGHVTTTVYDDLNRPIKVIDALSQTALTGYDPAGHKISETNKRGVRTTYVHDRMARVTSVTKGGVRIAGTSYDDNGNVQSSTDANGNTTSYTYDKRNLRTQEARLLAAVTNYGLDAMGDATSVTDPEGRATTHTYDLRRHLLSQRNAAGEVTTYAYDGAGNRVTTTRPAGGVTTVTYDGANRVKQITDPAGTTVYGYDKNSNHTQVKDANQNVTTNTFDTLNRRTQIAYPGGATESLTYDKNSNLQTHTDGNGVVITHGYDALNREVLASYSASADGLRSIATAYDENNNVKTVTQTGTAVLVNTFSYDNFDREEIAKDGYGATATKTYDANGNKTALVTQDGKVTTYAYDALNRLKSMVSQSGTITYAYDRSSLNTKVTYGNGVISTMTYDLAGRVKSVVHTKGVANLSSTLYEYDINGNRTSETINRTGGAQATTYGYDASDRLTKTVMTDTGKSVTSGYGYDAVANRTSETVTTVAGGATSTVSKTYTYDGRNELKTIVDSSAGTTTLDYDQQGNLVQKTVGSDLTTYAYNARDNLMSVARNSTVLGRYFNDFRGLRVEKEAADPLHPDAGPVRLRTLWDGRNAFQDSTVDGTVTARYENDGRHPVSMWSRNDGVQSLHRDALGSIVATTDTAGQLKSETIYDAWGKVQTSTGASANKFGYTGHQMDHETGLVYFQARYYDPEIGRFITQDPYEGNNETPLSLHHYLYAYGNPTTFVDLNGYESVSTMIDNAAEGCGAWSCAGYALAKGAYVASGLGFASIHDPVRDQYDEGKITGGQYVARGIGGGAAMVAVNVGFAAAGGAVTGRVAAVGVEQAIARASVTGAAYAGAYDVATQGVSIAAGLQSEYDGERTAKAAAIGGTLAGSVPGFAAGLATETGTAISESLLNAANRATKAVKSVPNGLANLASYVKGAFTKESDTLIRGVTPIQGQSVAPILESATGSDSAAINAVSTKPAQPLLLTYTPTSNTLSQIRNMSSRQRWEAGEQYVQELSGSTGQQHFDVPSVNFNGEQITGTGGRYVDAPVKSSNGGIVANEVKTYKQWVTANGQVTKNAVPLSDQIRQQVLKDSWLKKNYLGYDPRWIFLDAPPSPELARYLNKNGIIYVIHH